MRNLETLGLLDSILDQDQAGDIEASARMGQDFKKAEKQEFGAKARARVSLHPLPEGAPTPLWSDEIGTLFLACESMNLSFTADPRGSLK